MTLLLYGGSHLIKTKQKNVAIVYKIYKNNWKILWIHFRIKFHHIVNAAINIFSDLSWFLHILLFNLFLFCFCFVFFVTIFHFHGNLHYCYRGTAECIFSRIYFCEHITMEKKIWPWVLLPCILFMYHASFSVWMFHTITSKTIINILFHIR